MAAIVVLAVSWHWYRHVALPAPMALPDHMHTRRNDWDPAEIFY